MQALWYRANFNERKVENWTENQSTKKLRLLLRIRELRNHEKEIQDAPNF